MTFNNRYEFLYLFDVTDGNPNGDPDAGNSPRIDFETGQGLVTDVCLKRKIRNYILLSKKEQPHYQIYIKEKAVLETLNELAFQKLGYDLKSDQGKRKGSEKTEEAQAWMCENFYDIRTFGAVMGNKEANCGQVRGAVQLTFARSIDPIVCLEHTITRSAVSTKKRAEQQENDNKTMGRKYTVSYGLYKAAGFISANLANQTGFSQEDLTLLWEALKNMFDQDHSASKGQMSARGLYVFKHENALGNAPAHILLDSIRVRKKSEIDVPRHFSDYEITIDYAAHPSTVSLEKIL
ncbi:MAG: type I-C CRISPR-associated protein Cas7/Csd2 [Chlamydiota bacterium]